MRRHLFAVAIAAGALAVFWAVYPGSSERRAASARGPSVATPTPAEPVARRNVAADPKNSVEHPAAVRESRQVGKGGKPSFIDFLRERGKDSQAQARLHLGEEPGEGDTPKLRRAPWTPRFRLPPGASVPSPGLNDEQGRVVSGLVLPQETPMVEGIDRHGNKVRLPAAPEPPTGDSEEEKESPFLPAP